jgi:uncharacterized protein (DUF952 family)
MIIFKFCHPIEWSAAQLQRIFLGSAKDKEDGFLHFSTTAQLVETLARHFNDAQELVLVAVETDALGRDLKWETADNGQVYPHLYGPLNLSAVRWTSTIPRKPNGAFALPVQAFVQQGDDAPRNN